MLQHAQLALQYCLEGERGIMFLIIPEGGRNHPEGDGGAHPEGGVAPRGMGAAVSRGVILAS